jgi:ATP-dependent DNA helicase RecQ
MKHLKDIDSYCRGAVCRHRALVGYFGQTYEPQSCAACDICLGDAEDVPDALIVAQKILSCVARVKDGFGITHVVGILRGENTENIRRRGHEKLSTFGLLKECRKPDVRDWVYQLIAQGVLQQVGDEYPILKLTPAAWEVMRGERTIRLRQPVRRKKDEKPEKSKADTVSWEGVDHELFDALRGLRKELAEQRRLPAYVILNDATLRELARVRPSTLERMRYISGIGATKLADFGARFLHLIDRQSQSRGLSRDNASGRMLDIQPSPATGLSQQRKAAFDLFAEGKSIEEVVKRTERSRTTVLQYLEEFILHERPPSVGAWVGEAIYEQVAEAVRRVGIGRLKPIYLDLAERIAYDDIRIVRAHLQAFDRRT